MSDSSSKPETLAIIGAGVMAEAIISGLLERQIIRPGAIVASHPREERRAKLEKELGVRTVADNAEAASQAELVFLTIKPQAMATVTSELRGRIRPGQTVISVAAGTPLAFLREHLDHDSLVRVMPNTPAQIGRGMMVWTSTAQVPEQQAEQLRTILGSLGEELWVDNEKYVDMATALSGTGPTYVFLMMEALIDAGVHMGFPRRISEQIVLQTVAGSAEFARDSGKHMAELRNMVTSPGGTSAEAIYQMEKGSLRTVLSKAVFAAYQRTRALAEEQARNGKKE